jgi:hypothetical protein
VNDYQDARRIMSLLGNDGARQFLKLLELDSAVRADAFRQLHERGRSSYLPVSTAIPWQSFGPSLARIGGDEWLVQSQRRSATWHRTSQTVPSGFP